MSPTDPDSADQADMARLMAGQDDGLDALMDRHARALFGFLSHCVGDEDAAADLAQETFVRVYRNRHSFRPGLRFSHWLFTIAGNLARNHRRSRIRRPEIRLEANSTDEPADPLDRWPAAGPNPDEHTVLAEQRREVRAAVAELPDDLREAVILCELEDRTLVEAAGILDTTVKAVESRLYRARRQLRQRLSRWLTGRSASATG